MRLLSEIAVGLHRDDRFEAAPCGRIVAGKCSDDARLQPHFGIAGREPGRLFDLRLRFDQLVLPARERGREQPRLRVLRLGRACFGEGTGSFVRTIDGHESTSPVERDRGDQCVVGSRLRLAGGRSKQLERLGSLSLRQRRTAGHGAKAGAGDMIVDLGRVAGIEEGLLRFGPAAEIAKRHPETEPGPHALPADGLVQRVAGDFNGALRSGLYGIHAAGAPRARRFDCLHRPFARLILLLLDDFERKLRGWRTAVPSRGSDLG